MSENPRPLVLRPRVAEDLEAHVIYMEEHASPRVSERYLEAVQEAFDSLAEMPGLGAPREYLNARL